jgi:ribonuclease HI
MIEVYCKSGILDNKQRTISFIIKSSKYKWLRAMNVNNGGNLTQNQLESIGLLFALNHIKSKYRKKKVVVYTDSYYLTNALAKKNGEFINKTNVYATDGLRSFMGSFNNLKIKEFPEDEHRDELIHVYTECGLDNIELNEKD